MRVRNAVIPAAWFVAGVAVAVLTGRLVTPAVAEDKPAAPAKSAAGEAEAARAAYKGYAARHLFNSGQLDVDTLYRWSLRWAAAEAAGGRRKDAYAAHLDRMRKLAEGRGEAFKRGGAPSYEASATAFYVAEAERLAADSK
jgi:hypothetical protein